MAGAATATYSSDVLMSPGSDSHQDWEYSVPIRHDSFNRRSKSRSSHDSTSVHKSRDRHSRDRNSKGSRSSSMSRQVYAQDSGYLTSARGRRETSRNRKGSETSSRDVYGYEAASRSAGNLRESGDYYRREAKHGTHNMNDANWIHRDKLAKIESEELQQAALMYQRRMGESKRGRNGGSTVTTPPTEQTEPWPDLHEEHDFTSSPDAYGDSLEDRNNWDLRLPEEISATEEFDDSAASIYANPALRKSSSRIPISTASSTPIPDGRDGRGRALTNGDADSTKSRRASEPTADVTDNSTQSGGSRPGSRGVTSAKKKPPANRKTSAPASTTRKVTPKSRTTSATSQRPTTRSGETRPTTAVNRPEGDPPWLATMYKPDPRLPPEQQMLPTHARKLLQEQWEKEGKTPVAYDREFAPLAIGPDGAPRSLENLAQPEPEPEPTPAPETEKIERASTQDGTWPLNSIKSPEATRPSTGTGYSPMPKVQETPSAGLTPKWSPPVVSAPDPPKKERGCGCCIVM